MLAGMPEAPLLRPTTPDGNLVVNGSQVEQAGQLIGKAVLARTTTENTGAADILAPDTAWTVNYRAIRFDVAGAVSCDFAKSDGTLDAARVIHVAAGEVPPYTAGPQGCIRKIYTTGTDPAVLAGAIQGLV